MPLKLKNIDANLYLGAMINAAAKVLVQLLPQMIPFGNRTNATIPNCR